MSDRQLRQYRARLREALGVIERLQRKLAASQITREPVAIVGLACRFPGGGDGPEAFWRQLEAGVDAVREIPEERWPRDALPPDRPDLRWAGLLDRVDEFDAEFFGISPREAERLDPQQRLLLEVTHEAIEDAGIPADALAGAPVGVFAGLNSLDYQHRLMQLGVEHVDAYSATGTLLSTASGRVSYSLGLRGPCVSLDTACSSSLVAVALACQSLRAGDCELALAGGVTLLLWPYMMALAGGTQALSPDGRCKALDARANGFVRGEGCGVVALKRLSDARRDGDLVRAVIRGWSINQDGRSTGLTAPNVRSQEELIRAALQRAGRRPEDVGYLELHGTGTPLGDPIETEALRAVFSEPRADGSSCALGAVKTNLGHLEAAAGVAGLIKSVLALERGAIPRNLHFRRLNPRVNLEGTPFVIPTKTLPWPRGDKRRVAGVSSFGISGTNAHVILEEAPPRERAGEAAEVPLGTRAAELFVLSAKRPEALRALAGALREHIATRPSLPLADVARSLATTRAAMEHRLAVVASTRAELDAALASAAAGDLSRASSRGASSATRGRLAFLFTGQGSQRPGMGQALRAAWPAFREALERCAALLDRALDRSLLEIMGSAPGSPAAALLHETRYTQPAIFAHEYALAALWRSWGVVPELLAGHSVGELVAACVAGVMSLEDATRLVAARGRLMQALPAGGAMASIEAREDELAAALRPYGDALSIAAVNAPTQLVISGDADAVERVRSDFADRGARTRSLRVSHAFHSSRVEPMLTAFGEVAASVRYQAPTLPLVSTVTGALADASIATPAYWIRHAREAVRFADGARALYDAGARIFVELGPSPALSSQVPRCVPADEDDPVAVVPSIAARQAPTTSILGALGRLWTLGRAPRRDAASPEQARRVRLPRYPWQRRRFWIDPPRADAAAGESTGHPLLGAKIPSASARALYELKVSQTSHPWLADHKVAGVAVVPAAAYVEMLLAALAADGDARALERVTLVAPLALPERGALRVQIVRERARADADDAIELGVYSQPLAGAPGWTRHALATASRASSPADALELDALRRRCPRPLATDTMYARFTALGIAYGPCFRGVRALWVGEREALAELATPPGARDAAFSLAPALLDAGLQVVLAAIPEAAGDALLMPFELTRIAVHREGADAAWVYARLREGAGLVADLRLADSSGALIAEVEGLRLQPADRAALTRELGEPIDDALFELAWRPVAPPAPTATLAGRWLIVAPASSTLATALAGRIEDAIVRVPTSPPEADTLADAEGVICLWGHDHGDPVAAGQLLVDRGVALLQRALARPRRIVWVTRGAVAVTPAEPVDVALAPLWGLGRAVKRERPELRLALVDLAAAASVEEQRDAILRELASASTEAPEDELAWRPSGRHVARLIRARPPATIAEPPTPRGTTLITGGLGALGGHVARWLASRGAPHLLLTGRRGLDTPGATELVAQLEALGSRVTVAALDVADASALATAIEALPAELPLRGVVHAAGVVADALIAAQTPASVARAFAPKARGAWNLHERTRELPLDFFVLFSSLASVIGSAGQSNYAAANSFLDGLAAARRARGLPGQSLAWGAWSEGMAAALAKPHQDRLARMGMLALRPARGVALLERAMSRDEALLAIAAVELPSLARAPAPLATIWRELVRPAERLPVQSDSPWIQRLAGQPAARRDALIREAIAADVGRVLAWDPREPVPERRPLQELGLDSLMAVELRDALARRVGAALPSTLAFDHPTIEALASYLAQHVDSDMSQREADDAAAGEPSAAAAAAVDAPVAIIGMSCRLPGGVTDPESLWTLLDTGRDAIDEVPRARWDVDSLYDPDPDAPGTVSARCGGFVDDIDQFDPAFFGISPREAAHMDPQQRLLLETSWEALERAGLRPDRLHGSDAGVFMGLMYQEYGALIDEFEALDGYVSTGSAASIAAGRVSYVLGLKGPSVAVDTACSSSLVTTHLACQSLRQGECSLALAGGVALMLTPTVFVEFSRLRGLARDGRCKTFSAAADGVGWSEGCGVLVLKRLADAERDGDPILGVIRGSAVNQDGRSNGLTAPNGPSQEAVIRRALQVAGLTPAQLDYVECHGTGTALGDPIELGALGAVLRGAARERPLVIGSIKSNVGHTQAAAGAVGIIKVLLALAHERVPANLHFDEPTPHVPWSELPLTVAARPVEWSRGHTPRRAGVSSFGVSGTNAHVVIEEAPRREPRPATSTAPDEAALLVLSARTAPALADAAARLRDHLRERPALSLRDLAWSLATTRSPMDERAAIVARSREAADEALLALSRGETPAGCARAKISPRRPKLAFVFSGQGGQWLGMGRELLAREPAFRASLEACDRAIAAESGWSVLQVLEDTLELARDDRRARVEIIQPVLFAVQVALAALWRAWGVEPDAVLGHSMGEVAAAHVAGALSLGDAARVICRRSQLLQGVAGRGAMALVERTRAEAEEALRGLESRLSVAACNGPRSTVISGEPDALAELLARLEAAGVFCRRVKVDVASHSPQVDALRRPLITALEELRPASATAPFVSTVRARALEGRELDAAYWADNLRLPVRFAEVTRALLEDGFTQLLEIGPHPVLTTSIEETRRDAGAPGVAVAVGSLRRDASERASLLEAAGTLWTRGLDVDWERLSTSPRRRVALPTYPWQRERYWIAPRQPGAARGQHPLLGSGRSVSAVPGMRVWEATISSDRPRWLADHRVDGTIVLPAAGLLEMALAAARAQHGDDAPALERVTLREALTVPGEPTIVQLVTSEEDGHTKFRIASRRASASPDAWATHAEGVLRSSMIADAPAPARLELAALRDALDGPEPAATVYAQLAARGLEYGPAFQGLVELWRGDGRALGRARLPSAATGARRHVLHPALLDACFQVLHGALAGDEDTWLPIELGSLRVLRAIERAPRELWCHARLTEADARGDRRRAALLVTDASGEPLARVDDFVVQRVASRRVDDRLIELSWEPAPAPVASLERGVVVLLGGGATGRALRRALESAGHTVVHAIAGPPARLERGEWAVDDGDPGAVRALLRDALRGAAPTHVVHLRSLEAGDDLEDDAIESSLRRGCDSALHTVQAVTQLGYRDAPRLVIVTRGAQAIPGHPTPVSPLQAPVLGLARVVAMEHPELRCLRVDLDPTGAGDELAALTREVLGDSPEQELAWRGDARLAARLVRGALAPRDRAATLPARPRADGGYLITGGLGGLGLRVAAWLAERGAGHLALLSRSGITRDDQRAAVDALRERGATVTIARVDVAERDALARVVSELSTSARPLVGIVHAAGVLDDGLLAQQHRERVRAVTAPKINGAWNLHALTQDMPVETFVMFASAAGLIGAPGQGNYAAANAFLDALAHHRRSRGLAALSVDWGAFAEVGLAAAADVRGARLRSRGVRSLTPEEGLEVLERLLAADVAQMAVMPFDARQWIEFYPAASASTMLAPLLREGPGADLSAEHLALTARLAAADERGRLQLLEGVLRREAARVLRCQESALDDEATFPALGMDSLMGLELRGRLEAALGLRVAATSLWTYPSVAQLAAHLAETLAGSAPEAPAPAEAPAPLPEDDILNLLDQTLARARSGGST